MHEKLKKKKERKKNKSKYKNKNFMRNCRMVNSGLGFTLSHINILISFCIQLNAVTLKFESKRRQSRVNVQLKIE